MNKQNKKSQIIKIIRYVYLGIISAVILFLGVFLISSLTSKTSYTKAFGLAFFEVQSYSMYPDLDKGDLIIVKSRKTNDYEVGMVVTYIKPGETIPTTHKIVKIDGDMITTRGIANDSDDLPFDGSYIIGEVIGVWSNYHKARDFITNPLGIIVVILIGFFFIEGFNYLENKYSEDEKLEEIKKEIKELKESNN